MKLTSDQPRSGIGVLRGGGDHGKRNAAMGGLSVEHTYHMGMVLTDEFHMKIFVFIRMKIARISTTHGLLNKNVSSRYSMDSHTATTIN